MAVTEPLFAGTAPGGSFFVAKDETVVLETHCPDCGAALQLGTLDPNTTGGYSIPYVYCAKNCNPRHCAGFGD